MRPILLTLIIIFSYSQHIHIRFERLSVPLSQNTVFSITQDSIGFIWFATLDGLNRYDGYSIEVFRPDPENKLSLPDNVVQALHTDKTGTLWIGTHSFGLFYFNNVKETFHKPKFNIKGSSVYYIFSSNDSLIVLTDKGTNIIDLKSNKLVKFVEEKSIITYFSKGEYSELGIIANYIFTDSNGDKWIATDEGLWYKQKDAEKWQKFVHSECDMYSLPVNEITCIYEDKERNIWIGTSLGGVCKWSKSTATIGLIQKDKSNNLSSNKIRSFYEDDKGNIWIGTVNGGLNLWLQQKNKFIHWNTNTFPKLKHNHIRDILQWKNKYVIATDGGGIQFFEFENNNIKLLPLPNFLEEELKNTRIWDLHIIDSTLWLASYDKGVFIVSENSIKRILKDVPATWITNVQDTIFVATFGKGLFVITKDKILNFNSENSKLQDNRIYVIVPYKTDLLIGTKGGLFVFNRTNKTFTKFSIKDGLPNETIVGIVPDTNYNIWFSSNSGISYFNYKTKKILNFSKKDGLQENEFLVHSFLKLRNGKILFGGINGFNILPPISYILNRIPPKIVLRNVLINNDIVKLDSAVYLKRQFILDYFENNITLFYSALSFIAPEKNRYRYYVKGINKRWVENGNIRFINFTHLPPGKYLLYLQGANNTGTWSKPIIISIIITPAFWQTNYFKFSILLVLLIIAFIVYKLRVRSIKRRNILLEKLVEERTKLIEQKNEMIASAFNKIMDSITYAKYIQTTILPNEEELNKFSDNYIIYLPHTVVSGDFYILEETDEHYFFAVADCTGHGVPGAMLTIAFANTLQRTIIENPEKSPADILNITRKIITERQNKENNDGMDIALIKVRKDNPNYIEFSGAKLPLLLISKTPLDIQVEPYTHKRKPDILVYEIKGDRQSIKSYKKYEPFTNHILRITQDTILCLFSDGVIDQFGGPNNRKLGIKNLKKLLIRDYSEKIWLYGKKLLDDLLRWQGSNEQIDDITLTLLKLKK